MRSYPSLGDRLIRAAGLALGLTCAAGQQVLALGQTDRGVTVRRDAGVVTFKVLAPHATRVELWLYRAPLGADEVLAQPMQADGGVWQVDLPLGVVTPTGAPSAIYYGYRAWGPNWPYAPGWTKGSSVGFVADVDPAGNRYNPNKLLLDPYAQEVSHDPKTPAHPGDADYCSGAQRTVDTGRFAPKGVIVLDQTGDTGAAPGRPFKDDIIYEVHLRGLTENDPSVPATERGTYAGAAEKATALQQLGVTALEFLPVADFQNDTNDLVASTDGDNYWGYDPNAYFAPDRRYAADRSPGGPMREFRRMVKAFHQAGLKVYVDVVFNHTGEAGVSADGTTGVILSLRGLDNATYYELTADDRNYWDISGVGGALNLANPDVRQFVMDCLDYWHRVMGVDGFRFDLAVILGNSVAEGGFAFDKLDPKNVLNRAVRELPERDGAGGAGVDLIAEPWGAQGGDVYQFGQFPLGWAEWNDHFRDTVRGLQNELGNETIPLASLADRMSGSATAFQDDGRKPYDSVNFVVAHDGFTLRDLYAYNQKRNDQPWPFGPSPGGTDNNRCWDQGDDPAAQRQAARTGFALALAAAGVPMITGGDELYRTQYGNNNAYNLDSEKNWIDYADGKNYPHFCAFARGLIQFRRAHAALRRAEFFDGHDHDGNGLKDIEWLTDGGGDPDAAYLTSPANHFLAWRIDGEEGGDVVRSLYFAYNGWKDPVTATLPPTAPGKSWYRVADTAAWMEDQDNIRRPGQEDQLTAPTYTVNARSVLILIER